MYDKLTIQERIRDLRYEKRLTLEELSDKTGLSKSAFGSYESNDTKDISCAYISDKKLNKRLLKELISHEGFPRLLADIEIYIDNIAGMHDSSRQSFAPYGILTHGLMSSDRS